MAWRGRPADGVTTGGEQPTPRDREAGLDGLRGIAAMSVVLFHVYLYGRPGRATSPWEAIPMRLSVGLLLFFVLSGFLLYRSFERAARAQRRKVDISRYARRRAARILPAYYVCLIVSYPLLRVAEPLDGVRLPPPDSLWMFAVMAQNFSLDTLLKLNPVTWTLVVEVCFYVLLPLLGLWAFEVARGRRRPQVAMALALVAIGLVWSGAVHAAGLSQIYTKALPAFLPYFGLGILGTLWLEWRAEQGRAAFTPGRTAVMVLGGVALVIGDGVWHALAGGGFDRAVMDVVQSLASGAGFALVLIGVAAGSGPWAAWAGARPLGLLGTVSYGVYLWHVPVILYLQHLGLDGKGSLLLGLVAIPVTLVLGAFSWRLVEKPLLERAAGRRRAATPAPASA